MNNPSTIVQYTDKALKIKTANGYCFWVAKKLIQEFKYIPYKGVTQLVIPAWYMVKLKASDLMLIVDGQITLESFPKQTTINFK